MKRIESSQNKIIRLTRSLGMKKYRREHGLFVAEGERLVQDGLKKATPAFLIIQDSYSLKEPVTCPVYQVPESLFVQLSDTKSPQGILGVFPTRHQAFAEFQKGNTLFLNGVSDPGNVGTLLRTAEAAGFSNVVLDGACADLYHPKTVRSTMSALFNLNLFQCTDSKEGVLLLKEKGLTLVGTALLADSENLYSLSSLTSPVGLLIGSEARGLSKELLPLCHYKVKIPILGKMDSLNAAVAGSVIMYEMVRREYFEKK